ncbi:MAG: hypothetical protein K0Q59_390 [Paenibacillus sp.]|jgi:hypothetical protein|nr:hypothetical protein [Paenibacillus sp.]
MVSRVTPLTTAAQQVVVSSAVAGLSGYLTSQITSRSASAGADANPLSAVVAGCGDTFYLCACLVSAGVALSLLLRKPKLEEEDGIAGGEDHPNPAAMTEH